MGVVVDHQHIEAIRLAEHAVIDWEIVVTDAAADVTRALEALRTARRELARASEHLRHLVDLAAPHEVRS